MATGKDVLNTALAELGTKESPPDSNRVRYNTWYYGKEVSGSAYPWCMAFVQWCYAHAGAALPLKTASCGALLRWYRANQPECIVSDPIPGCIVIFDFPGGAATDHTGIFVSRGLYGAVSTVTTIDGNTSGVKGTNEANGGWVQQKTRSVTFARPTYSWPRELQSDGDSKLSDNEEDGDMQKRYNTMQEIEQGAAWAAITVQKLIARKIIGGNDKGLDLSEDMLRMLVFNDRAGLYK